MRLRKQAVRSRLHPLYYVLCQHLCRRAINRGKTEASPPTPLQKEGTEKVPIFKD